MGCLAVERFDDGGEGRVAERTGCLARLVNSL